MAPPVKPGSAATPEHKPDEKPESKLGNPQAGKAQEDPTTWLKECEPHIPTIVSQSGPGGGENSSPPGK
jgi:hypothetical protein